MDSSEIDARRISGSPPAFAAVGDARSGPGLDAVLHAEARAFVTELLEHGVVVPFDYAYEAVTREAVEELWMPPARDSRR